MENTIDKRKGIPIEETKGLEVDIKDILNMNSEK